MVRAQMCDVRLGLKKSPFPYINCVSWDRLYLEDRFESNGSQEKRGSMPGLSVYYNAVLKTKSLSFSPIKK